VTAGSKLLRQSPNGAQTEGYPIVTVHIAGTIYAQGPTVVQVDRTGKLPTDKNGLLAIRTGETTLMQGRPLSGWQGSAASLSRSSST
jgi:hypothetical protein